MFIGHYAAAFAAKGPAPRGSLGWFFAAAQWPDLVWPIFVLAGLERVRIAPGDTAFTPLGPDLPIVPGGPVYGLGLWNSVPATIAVELTFFALAVALYTRVTRPLDGKGRWALWGFGAFLLVIHAGNVIGPPPPPSPRAVAGVTLSLWLVPLWGAWIDRHRAPTAPARAG